VASRHPPDQPDLLPAFRGHESHKGDHVSESDDRVRQQREIDAETAASTRAMLHAMGAARSRYLNRREAELDERERRLDHREAELDRRAVAQGVRDDVLRQRQVEADERDRQADQREINAQTTWPQE
jgi:hypothetical protein